MTDILTPDFYEYAWVPLADARIDGEFVRLSWPDGVELRAHAWWLRENVVGAGGVDPVTREGTAHPVGFADDLTVRSCEVADGALHAEWTDGYAGALHPGWLRHVAEGRQDVAAWLPPTTTWTPATLPEPPTFSGPDVLEDDRALVAWLRAMVEFGLARLVDVPTGEHAVLDVTNRIGAQRDTNFGLDWPVKAEILSNDQNSTANTDLRLGAHTDLPTREIPPGFQFLHCVTNEVSGGWSTMADGEAIADYLRTDEPDVFDALSTLR
ncbi:MAG: TauD/TfdA family dioxygenase [Actinomycetota bacterium]